jgi:hypothetical protein
VAVRDRAVLAGFARDDAAFGFAPVEAAFAFARVDAACGFPRAAVAFAAGFGSGAAVDAGEPGEAPDGALAPELPDAADPAPPARPGRSRLALRRAGRVRERFVITSRSVPLASLSLGGMARLCPNCSGPPAGAPKHRRTRMVSAPHPVATVAGTTALSPHGIDAIS